MHSGPDRANTSASSGYEARQEKQMLTAIATLDEVLHAHREVLGRDFTAYRNHTYRVTNLCIAQTSGVPEQIEKTAIAAAFHDLGIWTDGTFDYLPPSVRLANAHLIRLGKEEWTAEITEMILEHHKISAYHGNPQWLVEPFRRADWADVSRGIIRFGLSRSLLREIFATWPDVGFHNLLVRLELTRLRTHPWNPLPMMRL
jgi:hypothetical protein